MYQNYTTQNEKIERISEKTLVIGVDIAKDRHYAQVVNWRKQAVRKGLGFNIKEGQKQRGRFCLLIYEIIFTDCFVRGDEMDAKDEKRKE